MKLIWLLFSFKGRIRRIEYWLFTVGIAVLVLLPAFTYFEPYSEAANNYVDTLAIVLLWPTLAVQAKRWHDRDKSAWWILINFVPLIGFFWALIENGFMAGNSDANSYGEPYAGIQASEI